MDNLHTLQRLQGELNEEMHRLTLLRDVFQAQHCADELDAASHLEAAHIAHCSARRSSQRIRELQSLVALLRHGGPRRCEECGEDIPLARLMAAPGATRCCECQQNIENDLRTTMIQMKATPLPHEVCAEYC